MKTRLGFVSNSSSSSFTLASRKALTKSSIDKMFKEHPEIFEPMIKKMKKLLTEKILDSQPMTIGERIEDLCGDDAFTRKCSKKDLNFIYSLFLSDDGCPIEQGLCEAWTVDLETDNLLMEKSTGY